MPLEVLRVLFVGLLLLVLLGMSCVLAVQVDILEVAQLESGLLYHLHIEIVFSSC